MGYFQSLASLSFDKVVDVIAIAQSARTGKTRGPNLIWTAKLLQPSGATTHVSIFRPSPKSLPSIHDGDVVLLRNFRVSSSSRELYLKSQDDSAWAVFATSLDQLDVSTAAAPVEYSATEESHIKLLSRWWRANRISISPKNPLKTKFVALAELLFENIYDIHGKLLKLQEGPSSPFYIYITDYASASDFQKSDLEVGISREHGECLCLGIELRLQDARYASKVLREGDCVDCRDVLIRRRDDGKMYGTIEPEILGKLRIGKSDC